VIIVGRFSPLIPTTLISFFNCVIIWYILYFRPLKSSVTVTQFLGNEIFLLVSYVIAIIFAIFDSMDYTDVEVRTNLGWVFYGSLYSLLAWNTVFTLHDLYEMAKDFYHKIRAIRQRSKVFVVESIVIESRKTIPESLVHLEYDMLIAPDSPNISDIYSPNISGIYSSRLHPSKFRRSRLDVADSPELLSVSMDSPGLGKTTAIVDGFEFNVSETPNKQPRSLSHLECDTPGALDSHNILGIYGAKLQSSKFKRSRLGVPDGSDLSTTSMNSHVKRKTRMEVDDFDFELN